MKTIKNAMVVLLIMASATAFAQDNTQYVREGDQIKVVHYYADSENIRETGYFKDGVSHGRWVQYTPQGDIKIEAFYNNGKKEGTWFVWDTDGKTLYELSYADNRLVKSHKWSIEQRDLLADN